MPTLPAPSIRLTVLVSILSTLSVVAMLLLLQPYMRPELAQWLMPAASAPKEAIYVPPAPLQPTAQTEENAVIRLVRNAKPAIVAVLVYSDSPQLLADLSSGGSGSPADNGLTPTDSTSTAQQIGGGTGFFLTEDGTLVTNRHVVDFDRATFRVVLSSGQTYPATLLGKDPVLDLAFLKVDGHGFPFLSFADSDKLNPGQSVIAIGNAFDEFRNSVTKGIVSGLNRRVYAGDGTTAEFIEEAIQTDAAINPGNSGGPLLDLNGDVVGLNTAVSEQGQLIGFALPSNVVRRDADMMKQIGRIVRPYLGVRYQIITNDYVQQNHLAVDHGALVVRGSQKNDTATSPGSPAEKAGIIEGDVILEVDGQVINEEHSLSAILGRYTPGETVTLKIFHGGSEKLVSVTLTELK